MAASVSLPLIANCDVMQEYECYVPKANGDFTKKKKRVYSFHHANRHSDYKRSKPEEETEDVEMGSCVYVVEPEGTFTGPLVDRIRALCLRNCPKTRRIVRLRCGIAKDRMAARICSFMLGHLPKTRRMVENRPPPAAMMAWPEARLAKGMVPKGMVPKGITYRSLSGGTMPMAKMGAPFMRSHRAAETAPPHRRFRRGFNVDTPCVQCGCMYIRPMGYGTFKGVQVARLDPCPMCARAAPCAYKW